LIHRTALVDPTARLGQDVSVVPGDQIRFELDMLQFRGKTCKMKGVGYVDGQVVAEAEMMASVVDR